MPEIVKTSLEDAFNAANTGDNPVLFNVEDDIFAEFMPETPETVIETAKDEKVDESVKPTLELENNSEASAEASTALQIFRGLQDPTLAPLIIAHFNKTLGTSTPEEAFNPLIELKKAFPEGYEDMAERLTPAIIKVVDKLVELRVEPVRKNNDDILLEKTTGQVQTVYGNFIKEDLGLEGVALPPNYESEMKGLVQKFPWDGKLDVQDYTKNLLYMAKGKLGVPAKAVETVTKTKSPVEQLARSPKPSGVVPQSSTPRPKLSVEDAFNTAFASLRK